MIGDVNVYLDEEERRAEIEIMIAEADFQGRQLGRLATQMMMDYSSKHLKINQFEAKIGFDNSCSLKMFEKLGFLEESKSLVFREVTLVLETSKLEKVIYTTSAFN